MGRLKIWNGTEWVYDETGDADGRELGYAQITANIATTSVTLVDAPGLSVSVTIGTRPVKITVFTYRAEHTVSNARVEVCIYDVTAAATISKANSVSPAANGHGITVLARHAPVAGARTYKVQYRGIEAGTSTLFADPTYPAFLLVEEI